MVRGAKWLPAYDIRVDAETDSISCTNFGRVAQRTAEDWEGTPSVGRPRLKALPVHRAGQIISPIRRSSVFIL